ncbi:major capsid protein [Paenibacillus alba]|uniref:Major capsid protein n=1 Tax=Paenibacillus alba TaxID=1197127 RepID=A0ABU6GAS5_9BACL|nr:major capsid protein [Paenibacillus alba]MEC0231292.1 major capsid protein [Paenibacillus alba]
MGVALSFPTTQEINHVVRNTIVNTDLFRGKEFAPMDTAYSARIDVDVIPAVTGVTAPHALNADPKVTTLTGQSMRSYATGYWRETYRINEEELLFARQEGTYSDRAGYMRVMRRSNELNVRLETRIEQLRWLAVTKGKIDIKDNNVQYTVDMKVPSKNKPAALPWLTDPTRDIVKDLGGLQELYYGSGAKLDTIYIGHDIAKAWASNATIKDLMKQSVYATNLSPSNVSKALQLLFPELKFEVYTEGYSDGANFIPFIPAGAFSCVGKGSEKAMDFCSTLAIQNGGVEQPQPGKFASIEDRSTSSKNPYIDITVGINGLPRMHHPEWFVIGQAN